MSEQQNTSAAALFDTLTKIAELMRAAEKQGQGWQYQETGTRDAKGVKDGGVELRLRIYPPGVQPSAEDTWPLPERQSSP